MSYSATIYRTLGQKMKMVPISGNVSLRFTNIGPLPSQSSFLPSKLQIMVSCAMNLAELDWYVWMSDASPISPDAVSIISPNVSQCFNSTLNSSAFQGRNAADEVFELDPRIAPFYRSERFWCGGMKYQWCPNKTPSLFLANAQGDTAGSSYSVSLKTFVTQQPPRTAISTVVKPGAPPVPYLEMLMSPFEKFQRDNNPVSGFLRNPTPISPNSFCFDSGDINPATVENDLGTSCVDLDTNFRLKGFANFIFEISFPPLSTAIRLVGIDLGTINVKKYFWTHPSSVVKNMLFDNSTIRSRMAIEKTRTASPDFKTITPVFTKMKV